MTWWISVLVFLASVVDDIFYVFFVRRVMDGSKFTAACLSALLTAIVSLEGYAQYAVHPGYIVANAMGSAVGCPLAMWWEERFPRKRARNKKTGQFKPRPIAPYFQQGERKP